MAEGAGEGAGASAGEAAAAGAAVGEVVAADATAAAAELVTSDATEGAGVIATAGGALESISSFFSCLLDLAAHEVTGGTETRANNEYPSPVLYERGSRGCEPGLRSPCSLRPREKKKVREEPLAASVAVSLCPLKPYHRFQAPSLEKASKKSAPAAFRDFHNQLPSGGKKRIRRNIRVSTCRTMMWVEARPVTAAA